MQIPCYIPYVLILGNRKESLMRKLTVSDDGGSAGIGDGGGGSVNGAGSGGIADAGSSFVGDGGGVIDPYTT